MINQVSPSMSKSPNLSVGSSFLIGKKNLRLRGAINFINPYFALMNPPLLFKTDLPKTKLLGEFSRIIKVACIFFVLQGELNINNSQTLHDGAISVKVKNRVVNHSI